MNIHAREIHEKFQMSRRIRSNMYHNDKKKEILQNSLKYRELNFECIGQHKFLFFEIAILSLMGDGGNRR